MGYKIFISHAWADRWLASQIERRVRALGAETFMDTNDIEKGDDIEDRIFTELPKCDELFALFTPWAIDRNWLWVEIGAARGLGLRIVTALYSVALSTIDAERGGLAFLKAKNAVDINDLESYFDELKDRLEKVRP
ncbi:TIR domain-containing protein [Hoeflea marina]|uniref:TIR domain-containing protein n=1 Tax=Hoeflea marina TaxID=274592 RepID=A0A317PD26_9HYPH|nr:toll/interleukin-1 receptor domain-containing protein [Hoeflea marina]PWV97231.1 TIR domain-containing protein [Hoeflea marina]